ncbi:hypothetical protein ACTL6U_03315 [Rhodovibrionaceae bacterium A322]
MTKGDPDGPGFDQAQGSALPVERHQVAGFTSMIVVPQADGSQLVSSSRSYRKALPPIEISADGHLQSLKALSKPWFSHWAPTRLAWWIAVLFIIGSSHFIVGCLAGLWPGIFPEALQKAATINLVFFVGSLFFTSAAGLQFLEAVNHDITDLAKGSSDSPARWRWLAWKPENAGYCASLVQFLGTILFNFNTGDAMIAGLNGLQEDILIWVPNFVGSLCFLLSGYLALLEVSHSFWSIQITKLSWWIALINLSGCIAFMAAAFLSFYLLNSGELLSATGANACTLFGALCFWLASYLGIPELFGQGRQVPLPLKKSQQKSVQ